MNTTSLLISVTYKIFVINAMRGAEGGAGLGWEGGDRGGGGGILPNGDVCSVVIDSQY